MNDVYQHITMLAAALIVGFAGTMVLMQYSNLSYDSVISPNTVSEKAYADVQIGVPITRDGDNHPGELLLNPEGPVVALLKSNTTLWINRGAENIRVTPYRVVTNSGGLRDEEIRMPKPENQTRVLVLGDSNVFGWRLNRSDRFTDQMEVLLNNRSNMSIRVINAGIPGAQMEDYYLFLRERGVHFNPDLVIVVFSEGDNVPLRVMKRIEEEVLQNNPEVTWQDEKIFRLLRERQSAYVSQAGTDLLVTYLQKIDALTVREDIEPVYFVLHRMPERNVQEVEDALQQDVITPPHDLFENPDKYRYSETDRHFTSLWHDRISVLLYREVLNQVSED